MGSSAEAAIQTLRYHPDWFTFGWLDEEFLREQLARYHQGDDPNTEHYRYAAFRRILQTHSELDDAMVALYVELARRDSDATMGEAAFIDLLWWRSLTAAQFDWLEKHLAFPTSAARDVIERVRRRQAQQ